MSIKNKEMNITTRKTNNERIIDYLNENSSRITTTDLAKKSGIDIKNISRYLKQLESENKIIREISQEGKIRVVYISLMTRKENTTTRNHAKKSSPKSTAIQIKKAKKNKEPQIPQEKFNDQKNSQQIVRVSINPREKELNNYISGMFNEVQSYGRVIPIDTKQSIVNNVFDNILNLTKGIKYYLNAWENRYQRYLKDKPENPLIDDYRDMQKTLEFLSKLKKLKEMIKRYRKP